MIYSFVYGRRRFSGEIPAARPREARHLPPTESTHGEEDGGGEAVDPLLEKAGDDELHSRRRSDDAGALRAAAGSGEGAVGFAKERRTFRRRYGRGGGFGRADGERRRTAGSVEDDLARGHGGARGVQAFGLGCRAAWRGRGGLEVDGSGRSRIRELAGIGEEKGEREDGSGRGWTGGRDVQVGVTVALTGGPSCQFYRQNAFNCEISVREYLRPQKRW